VLLAGLFAASCNDWTETESVSQKTQRPNEQDPELWAQYTAALREYKLHPDQLLQPEPVTRLKSAHPNHWWQIDPSLCVLYYLPKSGKDTGLRVAGYEEFYKNKPQNLVRVIDKLLTRFVAVEHASGCIAARFYVGGETTENLLDFLMWAFTQRHGADGTP
jgi:hypothetical protein